MLHLIVAFIIIFLVWHSAKFKDWKQYHSTMLFFSFMELVYRLIAQSHEYFLWRLVSNMIKSEVILIGLYVFIVFPGTALAFLSNYPSTFKKQFIYSLKWIVAYGIFEFIATLTNHIEYYHGWNLGYSILIDIMIFPGLVLHYKKPLIAYLAFIMVTAIGIYAFRIPIW